MKHRPLILIGAFALLFVSLGCGLTVNLPVDEISTIPLRTEEIYIPAPDVEVADVELVFGAGKLKIQPGTGDALISGQAVYNVEDLKPEISVDNALVRIVTGNFEIQGLPRIKNANNLENSWDLALGKKPVNLKIQAGAYQGIYELGGLAIKSLEVNDGAADIDLKFSQPNLIPMDTLRYVTGASSAHLSGLANANFASMIFRSGAGDITLDFSGTLVRDAVVTIEAGVSQVVVIVPAATNTRVIFKGGLSSIETSGTWERSGDQYLQPGSGPLLTINVDLGAGNLELRND